MWIFHILFTLFYPFISWWVFGFFCFLAIMNNAAINLCVHVFVRTQIPIYWIWGRAHSLVFFWKAPLGGSNVQSVLRTTGLEPWYSVCGPWACSTTSPGSLLEIWTLMLQPHPDLLNQTPHTLRISEQFIGSLKSERLWRRGRSGSLPTMCSAVSLTKCVLDSG